MINKAMNAKKLLIILLSYLLCLAVYPVYAHNTNQTHNLDTTVYHFKLSGGDRIFFDADIIYLGDSNGLWNWINNDTIRFFNLRITETDNIPDPLTISLSGQSANMTITTLFDNRMFKADVTTPNTISTLILSVGSYGYPTRVFFNGLDTNPCASKDFDTCTHNCWYYDSTSQLLYLKIIGTTITIDWTPAPIAPRPKPPKPSPSIIEQLRPVLSFLFLLFLLLCILLAIIIRKAVQN